MRRYLFLTSLLFLIPSANAGVFIKGGFKPNSLITTSTEKTISTVVDFDGDATKLPNKNARFPIVFQIKEVTKGTNRVGPEIDGIVKFDASLDVQDKFVNVDGKFKRQTETDAVSLVGLEYSGEMTDQGDVTIHMVKSQTNDPEFEKLFKETLEESINEGAFLNRKFELNKPIESNFQIKIPAYQGIEIELDIDATYELEKLEGDVAHIIETSAGRTIVEVSELTMDALYEGEAIILYHIKDEVIQLHDALTTISFSYPLNDGHVSTKAKTRFVTTIQIEPLK